MKMRLDQDESKKDESREVDEDNRRNEKNDDIKVRKVFFCPNWP